MKLSRWVSLAAGCLVMASSGLNYSFSIIAPAVKSRFGFTDLQVASIASTINLGGYLAILSGWAYDAVAHRHNFGPRVVMWVGSILMFLGYGGMWAQATHRIQPSLARMLICAVLAGNAGTWWDTSVLVTTVRNFPDDRGSVLGICKGFLGLSTSLYASLYWLAFAGPSQLAPPPASPSPASALGGSIGLGGQGMQLEGAALQEGTGLGGSAGNSTVSSWAPGAEAAGPGDLGLMAGMAWAWQAVKGAATGALTGGAGDAGPVAFIAFIACTPSLLNFLGSLLINHVPLEYVRTHEPLEDAEALAHGGHGHGHGHGHGRSHGHGQQQGRPPAVGSKPPVSKAARLTSLYCLVAALAVFQAGSALYGRGHPVGVHIQELQVGFLLGSLSLVLLLPISAGPLVMRSLRKRSQAASSQGRERDYGPSAGPGQPGTAPNSQLQAPLLQGGGGGAGRCSDEEGWYDDSESSEEGEEATAPVRELSPGQAARTAPFWALFWVFACGAGAGLTLLNNLAPLVVALGGQKGGQVAFVSLFSVANAAGRLIMGHISEHYLHRLHTPRPVFLCGCAALMALSCAALALSPTLYSLYPLSLLCGFAFGGHWSTIPAVASDLFGLRNFAGNYCVLQFGPAIGAYGLATYLAGSIADASKAHSSTAAGDCLGQGCFGPTFAILAGLSSLSVCACVWLLKATLPDYRAIVSGRR